MNDGPLSLARQHLGVPPAKPRSLLAELAGQAGLEPTKYYAMLKELCGCREAKDEHFAALMLVAQGVGLNPVMAQMYLVPTQKGVKPVIGIDGYLVFLHRALKDGTLEWHDFKEEWIPDPRLAPEKAKAAPVRAGRVILKFRGRPEPVEHVELFSEIVRDTAPWKQHSSRMLRHKTYSQAIRYHLGLYVPDAEEAGALRDDEPRRVEVEARDAAPIVPVVPIAGLRRAEIPAAEAIPDDVDEDPVDEDPMTREESLALDRQIAEEDARREAERGR